jgi:hypothetical protein
MNKFTTLSLSRKARDVRAGCIAPARYFNRRDVICKPSEAASHTKETRLSFPVLLSDVTASGTRPRCIARIYHHDRHTRKDGFVRDVCPQLSERPTKERGTLSPSNRNPRANVRQVFQRYRSVRALGFLHDLFADVVIHPTGEPLFLASALLQKAFGRLRSFALELCPHPAVPMANPVHGVPTEHGSVAIDCDVLNSEIDAERTIDGQDFAVWYVAERMQIKFSILKNEVGLTLLKLQERSLSLATNVAHRLTSVRCPEVDAVGADESQNMEIIGSRACILESMQDRLMAFVAGANYVNGASRQLCSQARCFACCSVRCSAQREFMEALLRKCDLRNVITRLVESSQRFTQGFCLLGRREQFHLRDKFQRFILPFSANKAGNP